MELRMSSEDFIPIAPTHGHLVVRKVVSRDVSGLTDVGEKEFGGLEVEVVAGHVMFPKDQQINDDIVGFGPGARLFISRHVGVTFDMDGTEEGRLIIIQTDDVLGIRIPDLEVRA
jgi:hypothetical protein